MFRDERVLVVDDHEVVARRMAGALAGHFLEVQSVHNVREAVQSLMAAADAGTPFDALVLDLELKGERGEEVLDFAERLAHRPRAVVVSGAVGVNERILAVQARAVFLPKPLTGGELLAGLVPRPSPLEAFADAFHLTERELDILLVAAHGLTDVEIGEELRLGYGTVRRNIERAAGKVSASGRGGLLGAALRFVVRRASGSFPVVRIEPAEPGADGPRSVRRPG